MWSVSKMTVVSKMRAVSKVRSRESDNLSDFQVAL